MGERVDGRPCVVTAPRHATRWSDERIINALREVIENNGGNLSLKLMGNFDPNLSNALQNHGCHRLLGEVGFGVKTKEGRKRIVRVSEGEIANS